ncbi:MAG: nicotinate (nicotinamide) nucleotide adenylyltransferase [Desulfamplus sp.]|nr:nicotinate (nicotinamide) nucleotide adenylyltransferase [Desulfamplus sp.]
MSIGLFGGTFNPIHLGHIAVIAYVKSAFNLDTIYIVPSAIPPHKTSESLACANDRFEMVKQAVAPFSGLIPSDVELKREGKSFSIDTIKHFKGVVNDTTQLYFIMGSDAFFDIQTWKNSVDIFRLTHIIVMHRAGDCRSLKDVESFLKTEVSSNYEISESDSCVKYKNVKLDGSIKKQDFKSVYICEVPKINISSTLIREKIKRHESIKELVPEVVAAILYKKKLYL